jgi:hypothetical protein
MHIGTAKHKMLTKVYPSSGKVTTPFSQWVCHCEKPFSCKQSLSRHKKICPVLKKWKEEQEMAENKDFGFKQPFEVDNENVSRVVLDRKTFELMEENSKLKDSMIAVLRDKPCIISNGDNAVINANHHTLNVNLFLEQNYANAMNLHDFVRNIKCSIEDLAVTADQGYVNGLSQIFMRNLEFLDPKSRPIHCGDQLGTQIYIRDANKWEKDKGKLDSEIDNVAKKQIMLMSEWELQHPNWHRDEKLTHEYLNLVRQLTSREKGVGNEQIRKNVAKNVILDDLANIIDNPNSVGTTGTTDT